MFFISGSESTHPCQKFGQGLVIQEFYPKNEKAQQDVNLDLFLYVLVTLYYVCLLALQLLLVTLFPLVASIHWCHKGGAIGAVRTR